jgi:hypothetical protein
MTDKEAMELALDWFKCYADGSMSRNNAEALADEVVEALKERLAQPEQEPDDIASILACRDMLDAQPVPPRRTWADLSDEDIEECFTITPDLYLKRHIAQRILDKLKEKNT